VIQVAQGIGLCSSNCPTHKGGVYLFPHTHTHTKQKQKEQLKLQTPKTTLTKEWGEKLNKKK
jgi:hypothetical protein